MPPQIGFDIEEEESTKVPAPKASFLSDQNGADIVRQFLEQYYIVYDSDNRQPLLNAYHDQARFSLSCTFTANINHKWVVEIHIFNWHQVLNWCVFILVTIYRLVKYLPHNRNIQRVRDLDQRCNLIKNGKLPIVSFLSELPATEHDAQSFGVDLTVYTVSESR